MLLLTNLEWAITLGIVSVYFFVLGYLMMRDDSYGPNDSIFPAATFFLGIVFALHGIANGVDNVLHGEESEMLLKQQIHIEEQIQKEREEERQKPERIQELKDRLDALKIENAKHQEKGE